MNVALARELYGGSPILIDRQTFSAMCSLFSDIRSGINFHPDGIKNNAIALFEVSSATQIITEAYELRNDYEGSDLIYVINLNGVITKNGGMSSYGMTYLANKLLTFDADSRVVGGVIVTDSGGGSSLGYEVMSHALTVRTKPVVALIERAGTAASAAYGIISHADYIISESKTNKVGSIGTMLSFSGNPDKSKDADGAIHVTIYATASDKKNKWYEEAINNGNYQLAIDEVLNPFNNQFIGEIKTARPVVLENQLDGSVYNAGDVLGSLVDEIGNFDLALNKVVQLSEKSSNKKSNNKKQTTAMTAQEFKAQHPAAYQEVFNAGVDAERDRTGAWLAHAGTDLEAVKAGIEGGKEISATARENFLVKASSKTNLDNLKSDSKGPINTPESISQTEDSEAEAFYKKVNEEA